jgi:tetratricopeptide (TPR) repeat protein
MLIRPSFPRSLPSPTMQQFLFILLLILINSPVSIGQQHRSNVPVARSGQSPFSEAESLFAQGRLEEAKQTAVELLKLHPSSVEGYNLLGIIYSSAKDFESAHQAFEHALTLDPNSVKTQVNLGNLFVAEGKPDQAEKEFKKALTLSPANRDANYNLGLLLLAKGSPNAAIVRLQRVHPQDMQTELNLVGAYLQAERKAEGLKIANQLSAAAKNDVQQHFTLGLVLASEKQYKPAQLELERANALRPDAFEILFNLGQAYLRGGENAKAELMLNRALKSKPDSAESMYLLAQLYFNQSKPVDALELLVRARKIAPENTDIIFLLARISMTQNYFEDAIPLLESGLKIAPQRADLHAALGESYFMSGKTDKAIDEFKKLIDVDSSARSYAFMGLSYRHLGRFDEARKYFDEGLKHDPRNPACLFNLGFIEERQGNVARAEEWFQQTLKANPDFSDALLELANLRTTEKKFEAAAELLRRYVRVNPDSAQGYYKLAMAERSLHQIVAAQRDLNVFQTLSQQEASGPYPFQHLFDYLENRAQLSSAERNQLDVTELQKQIKAHPGRPQDLYLLAEAYFKLGRKDEAQQAISQLDQISADDYRTQAGVGVLLARYRLFDAAIQHFQTALRTNPDSDDVKFDLADACFRKGSYPEALQWAQRVSSAEQQDDTYLALLADIYSHLGDSTKGSEIYRDAIARNPDNDQYYLSMALVQLRQNDVTSAESTLKKGLARIPGSGKISWGLGLIAVAQGNAVTATERLERAVELLPEWAGSYSTLGVFYYQTGQIEKAREVLNRFKGSKAGGLDISRIEETLSRAPNSSRAQNGTIPMEARQQLLQLALVIADRTL